MVWLHVQVRYSDMPSSVLAAAKQLGGGRAQPALQLVGYEAEVEAAIKYTFGNAFICQVSLTACSCAAWSAAARISKMFWLSDC